jgi:hypothetical protein
MGTGHDKRLHSIRCSSCNFDNKTLNPVIIYDPSASSRAGWSKKIFAMIDAYIDESGIHGGATACIVAGYFGKKGPWRSLEIKWNRVLRRFKVPLQKFHAKELEDKRSKADFLSELVRVVSECRVHPFCYGIFVDDFFKLSLNQRKFVTGAFWNAETGKFTTTGCPNKPYFLAFTECLKIVTAHTPMASRAHFFFGVDRPIEGYAKVLFRYFRTRSTDLSRKKFGTISFPLAKQTPQLQLADLFSYLSYKHMLERRVSGDWTSPPSKLLLPLLQNRKSEGDTYWRSERLIKEMISVVPNFPQN